MTRKCSSATGSEVGGRVLLRRQGRESGIAVKISARKQLCQVLYIAKLMMQTRLAQIGYASPAMAPKRILLSTISLLVSLVCISSTSSAQAIPGPLATAKQIQNMLVQRVDVQHKSDGIVVGVITKQAREIISYGHFDRDDSRVPNGDTVFEIGSISKVFTSLLLSEMVLEGEVKLSDPISKYLPAWVHAPSRNGKQITLLDLATHYSGLPSDADQFQLELFSSADVRVPRPLSVNPRSGREIRILESGRGFAGSHPGGRGPTPITTPCCAPASLRPWG